MSLDIQQLISENIGTIIATIFGSGSLYGWFYERRKNKIQEKQLGADALKSMQDAYDKFTEDSLKRYEDLSTEVQDLKKKLIEVTTQLSKEKQNYAILREEHDNLKISYNKLKKDFDDYKKKYK